MARSVVADLATSAFPAGVPVSLRVLGHLEPGTCHVRLALPLAPFEPAPFVEAVRSFAPTVLSGTPLADALTATGEALAEAGGARWSCWSPMAMRRAGGATSTLAVATSWRGHATRSCNRSSCCGTRPASEVARGRVNLGPIEVPSGVYDLEVLSTPRERIDGVRVIERDVSLTVRLQEEAAP